MINKKIFIMEITMNKTSGMRNKSVNNDIQVNELTQEKMLQILDWSYDATLNGLPGQKNIDDLVDDYLSKYDKETAIKKLVDFQVKKATVSGFVTGFGGLPTMPITLPANITTVIYFQLRMIAAIAKIRGYNLKSDQVQTIVYTTLVGTSLADLSKKAGIVIGNKMLTSFVKKIPGKMLTKINQIVGFRLLTKFGTKGVINIGKMVPVVGGVIGGAFDMVTTQTIANVAKKTFTNVGIDIGDGIIIDKNDLPNIE
ncbi:EcsC family protein [Streptococcus zalophi]|uniref:EcsC family protein n=1 Tax=Streptococcus zalophi TaxID=640031 RepID=UPI0035A296F3